jgi:hypothetical protein
MIVGHLLLELVAERRELGERRIRIELYRPFLARLRLEGRLGAALRLSVSLRLAFETIPVAVSVTIVLAIALLRRLGELPIVGPGFWGTLGAILSLAAVVSLCVALGFSGLVAMAAFVAMARTLVEPGRSPQQDRLGLLGRRFRRFPRCVAT